MLGAWTLENAAPMAAAAVDCGDLALYASALWAARPDGYAFGLGVAVVLEAQMRNRQRETDDGQERGAGTRRARRSATGAPKPRASSPIPRSRAPSRSCMKERTRRRTREDEAIAAAGAAQAQVDALQTQLDQAHAEVAEQQNRERRARRSARTRSRTTCDACGPTRASSRRGPRARSRGSASATTRALGDAVAVARQLSVSLDALQRRVREGTPTGEAIPARGRMPTRRGCGAGARPARTHSAALPPGVVANSPAGVEAMLATPDVVLIVDGYNVAHRAWPDATAGDQRERLGIAATALCRRLGCEVVLVFDGNGSRPRPVAAPRRRAGAVLRGRRRGRRGGRARGRGAAPPDPRGGRVVGRMGDRALPRPGRRGGGRRRARARHSPRPLSAE